MNRGFDHDKNYDDIKSLINKVRNVDINETFTPGVTEIKPEDSNHLYNNLDEDDIINTTPEEVESKSGDKIKFDSINTVGYLSKSDDVNIDDNEFSSSIEELIKSTGLLLPYINIRVEVGRVIITSDVIKNPSLEIVKEITIDTDEEDIDITLVSGSLTLSNDLLLLLKSTRSSYEDPQIGRSNLIKLTQLSN